jgi:hypothetical protein
VVGGSKGLGATAAGVLAAVQPQREVEMWGHCGIQPRAVQQSSRHPASARRSLQVFARAAAVGLLRIVNVLLVLGQVGVQPYRWVLACQLGGCRLWGRPARPGPGG